MYYTDLSEARVIFGEIKKASTERIGPDERIDILNHALKLGRATEDVGLMAICKRRLSHALREIGHLDEALHAAKDAVGLYQLMGNKLMWTRGKYDLARFHAQSSNYHLSLIYALEALESFRQLKHGEYEARVQYHLGTIYEYFEDQKSAMLAYEKSAYAAKKVGNKRLESDAYNPLSGIYLNDGNIQRAEELIDESMSIKSEASDTRGMAFSLYGKGKIFVRKKQYAMAKSAYDESIRLHRENGEQMGLGMCYFKLGELHYQNEDFDQAVDALKGALNFARYKSALSYQDEKRLFVVSDTQKPWR
jgi:tetratricopeptide (TPR) repeat protein